MSLRTTFDRDPELYDRARPSYAPELFDDLGSLLPGRRLLEIGCGTGQATRELAERGYAVTCIELGPGLAEVARARLAAFPEVEIVVADFDTWQGAPEPFDGVVAFTSFHWLDPATRYAHVAAALRDGGVLAVVATHHVLPEDGDPFFRDVQADYRAVRPEDPASHEDGPPHPDTVAPFAFDEELFEPVAHHRYRRDIEYTADEYIAVLSTYSDHIALAAERREELFARIRRRIEPRGSVRKTYFWTLDAARKRPRPRP
ncbi:MAG TPA: class I SAM-dependent methyltransferase [Gaiellaceae bacterium]|nr:class I SAM-dependent methyltransferase [Gaiellaceae bacterium]